MRRSIHFLLATGAVLLGCNALLDRKDLQYDEAVAPGTSDGAAETSTTDAPEGEAGTSGGPPTCTGDVMTDKKNCGRCGHDCLGGDCVNGTCGVVALAGALAAPNALALDATNVYLALAGDDSVVRVSKTGGTVVQLVTGWQNMTGVGVAGNTLFWSGDGARGDAGDGNFGGLWKCTLPACTDKKVISTVGYVRHIDVKNGYVYYANESEIRRVKVDGTGDMTINATNQAFAVAADDKHVYYTSNQNTLLRSPITGGPGEAIGPLTAKFVGFVSLSSTSFYWAYTDTNDNGQVFGSVKAAPATRVSFGNMNLSSVGVGSDGKYVYWTNDGTATGIESNGDGELLACPVAGCGGMAPLRLAEKLHYGGHLVVDDAVYFLEFGGRSGANGRLLKLAKL